MKKLFFCFCLSVLLSGSKLNADPGTDISISTESFSPSAGQSVSITFRIRVPGNVTAEIIDIDENVIRTLASSKAVKPGFLKFEWDGRDTTNVLVKAGCYFPRIRSQLNNSSGVKAFQIAATLIDIKPDYYDRMTGVLSYSLKESSIVTVKAITTRKRVTGDVEHTVQKVIAERSPRTSGKVVEYFDGYSDNGVYLPQSDFSIVIQAQPLPPNAIVVYGAASKAVEGKI